MKQLREAAETALQWERLLFQRHRSAMSSEEMRCCCLFQHRLCFSAARENSYGGQEKQESSSGDKPAQSAAAPRVSHSASKTAAWRIESINEAAAFLNKPSADCSSLCSETSPSLCCCCSLRRRHCHRACGSCCCCCCSCYCCCCCCWCCISTRYQHCWWKAQLQRCC